MQAVWFAQTGAAAEVLQHGERAQPHAARGEVLVRLAVSAVHPSDVKKRAGLQPAGLQNGFVIPHSDGAGVIEAVGDGVSAARIGERVWLYQAQYQRHLGTAAEYIAVPSARAVPLPAHTDFRIGACLGIPLMTAHRCVFADGAVAGQTILVSGAAGRVGFYAAQLAKLGGARVLATGGSRQRCQIARQAGCDAVLNYRTHEVEVAEWVGEETAGEGVDRIIEVEFGVNIAANARCLKNNGVIASYASAQAPQPPLPFYPLMFNNILVRLVLVYNMPESAKQRAIAEISKLLQHDQLHHRYAPPYALAQTADAHQAVEHGCQAGCVLIEID